MCCFDFLFASIEKRAVERVRKEAELKHENEMLRRQLAEKRKPRRDDDASSVSSRNSVGSSRSSSSSNYSVQHQKGYFATTQHQNAAQQGERIGLRNWNTAQDIKKISARGKVHDRELATMEKPPMLKDHPFLKWNELCWRWFTKLYKFKGVTLEALGEKILSPGLDGCPVEYAVAEGIFFDHSTSKDERITSIMDVLQQRFSSLKAVNQDKVEELLPHVFRPDGLAASDYVLLMGLVFAKEADLTGYARPEESKISITLRGMGLQSQVSALVKSHVNRIARKNFLDLELEMQRADIQDAKRYVDDKHTPGKAGDDKLEKLLRAVGQLNFGSDNPHARIAGIFPIKPTSTSSTAPVSGSSFLALDAALRGDPVFPIGLLAQCILFLFMFPPGFHTEGARKNDREKPAGIL
mmetsp:Transcript_27188/g.68577  ORF Transcript_27188/g.68577 Transcript_27188/m.68577 type:complete len:410 (+) Transcript_27188:607-1836(+)